MEAVGCHMAVLLYSARPLLSVTVYIISNAPLSSIESLILELKGF